MSRRCLPVGATRRGALLALGAATLCGFAGCAGSQAAPAPPEPTGPTPTTVAPYVIRAQLRPQEPRLGQDENVVIQATFLTNQGRPVLGAQLSALVNYPTGPKTYTSEVTTFQDGRADLAVPVAPAPRGATVRLEVIMRYQGQEYRQNSGFTVR